MTCDYRAFLIYHLLLPPPAPGLDLRVIDRDGSPWFIAKDVCGACGLNVSDTRKTLAADEVAIAKAGQYLGLPNRGANVISESGLYTVILKSRKPQARAFQKWVNRPGF